MLDRIAYASVLCDALISEVNLAVLVNCDVLEEGVTLDSAVDVGFVLLREVDDLCVATTFEVEDALIVPSVFVVADEQTLRVGRKGGLTCARQAEEDSCVLTFHICVSRAVHRCDALKWKVVVLHGEHTLLHLTTIPSVDDNLLTSLCVEGNAGVGVEAEFLVVLNLSLAGIEDDEVRLELCEFLLCRLDEHVLDEVSLPSNFYDETNSQTSSFVSATESVDNVKFLAAKFLNGDVLNLCPDFFAHGMVVVLVLLRSPPNVVVALVVVNDVLVLRRTTCEDACHHVYCAKFCLLTYLVTCECGVDLGLVELLVRGVVSNHGATGDAVLFQINCCHCVVVEKYD